MLAERYPALRRFLISFFVMEEASHFPLEPDPAIIGGGVVVVRKTKTLWSQRAWEIGRLRRCEGVGEKVKIHCPLIGSRNANRPHSCLESCIFPIRACTINGWVTQILLMSNPVLSGHDLCFDRTGQWDVALKHGTWDVKHGSKR